MIPRALLFDFGGTIDTNGRHWSMMFRRGYHLCGVSATDEEFSRAFGEAEADCCDGRIRFTDGLFATLLHQTRAQAYRLAEGKEDREAQRIYEMAVQVARWSLREVGETLASVRPMLIDLHDKFKLGLVSNFYGNLTSVCDELGLLPLFETVIDSGCVGVRKPDSGIYRLALEAMNEEPRRTAMIGDSYARDIVPAKRVGCRTIWLHGETWEHPTSPDDADFIIGSILSVPDILREM
ncbi:MAG TPA: HAD family hydrolase [Bacteroidota bacterium]|nr:HAD family hydrolase [Bacteroidota bacterium]